MAEKQPDIKLTGFPRKLVLSGVLDESAAKQALQAAQAEKTSFIDYAVSKNKKISTKIAVVASHEFGLACLSLDDINIDHDIIKLV
ncbi:MAG: hypothetical protein CSA54_04595, partial [Gammaproteobacteria bacterium]